MTIEIVEPTCIEGRWHWEVNSPATYLHPYGNTLSEHEAWAAITSACKLAITEKRQS